MSPITVPIEANGLKLRKASAAGITLQRQCACGQHTGGGVCDACKEQERDRRLQRIATCAIPAAEHVPAIVSEVLQSPGQPLDAATQSFMEPLFGHDFSRVRVHTDARAGESARAVDAAAYTVGRHIVFASGSYQPGSGTGNRLLAHELAHTVQQAHDAGEGVIRVGPVHSAQEREAALAAGKVSAGMTATALLPASDSGLWLRRQWNACGTAESCPQRDAGEQTRAASASLQAGALDNPVPGFIVWGFAIGSSAVRGLTGNATWTRFDGQVASGADRWAVLGFSDCEGGVERNSELRSARANAARTSLSNAAQAKIGSVDGAPLTDCVAGNDTEEHRSFNRAVVFQRSEIGFAEEPRVQPLRCPPRTGAAVTSLVDYISLVRCAESSTRYNPRQMLAMLRQLYYGKPWSFTKKTSKWDNVIRCSPDLGNPATRLGAALFNALGNSAEVGGVDMGHVFTGMEAMACPTPTVDFYAGLATVQTPNEDFATWAGDLGAAVAAIMACPNLGSAAASRDDCGRRAGYQPLSFYLAEHAPPQDLEGDIDPYVLRASEAGIACSSSGQRTFVPNRPISQILGEYYYDPSTRPGAARVNRNRCFLELIGATFDASGRVNNRTAITRGPMRVRVIDFARAFYTNIAGIPSTPSRTELLVMETHAENALDWFITILETRAPVTP